MSGIYHSWNGTVLTITSDSGTSSADLAGAKGDTGIRGPQGVGGVTGLQGPQGPQGPEGPAGPAGPRGEKGADGTVSFADLTDEQRAGLKGDKGDQGDPGPAGDTGPRGPQGETGATGPQGPVGPQGPKGDTGEKGATGPQGPKGDTGATGPQGPAADLSNYYTKAETVLSITNKILNMHPVGTIYMSVNSTSPASFIGGTWERIKDRFLLAAGDSYTLGSTGGAATHTLTIDEMPKHRHEWQYHLQNNSSITAYGTTTWNSVSADTGWTTYMGGDKPHNNMPPYLTVNVWQRVA